MQFAMNPLRATRGMVGSVPSPALERTVAARTVRAPNDVSGKRFASAAQFKQFVERNHGTITLAPGASFEVFLQATPRLFSTTAELIRGFPTAGFDMVSWFDQPRVTLHIWSRITADPRAEPGRAAELRLVREKSSLTTSTTVLLEFTLKVG